MTKNTFDQIGELIWENARIARVALGPEDHGIMTCSLELQGDGWGQVFGGRNLSDPFALNHWLLGVHAVTGDLIKAPGRLIRAGRGAPFDQIVAIKPIIEDYPLFWPGDDLHKNDGLFRGPA